MPNCYLVIKRRSPGYGPSTLVNDGDASTGGTIGAYPSYPYDAGSHVAQCVQESGGVGELRKLVTDGKKLHAFVFYKYHADAIKYLDAIAYCLEVKGYEVLEAVIGYSAEELGYDIPGYVPGSDTPAV